MKQRKKLNVLEMNYCRLFLHMGHICKKGYSRRVLIPVFSLDSDFMK